MDGRVTCRKGCGPARHSHDEPKDGGTVSVYVCSCGAKTYAFAGPVVGKPAPRINVQRMGG